MKRSISGCLLAFAACLVSGTASAGDILDPTRPLGGRVAAAAPAPAAPVVLVLQSTLISPQRRLAIINGQLVGVGGRVGAAVVVDIYPGEVVLRRDNQEMRVTLAARLDKRASAQVSP